VDFRAVQILWHFLQPFHWVLPIIFVLGLAASFAEGIGIGLLIPFFDLLLGVAIQPKSPAIFRAMNEYLSSLGDEERILLIGGGIFALLVIKAILLFATVSLSAWTDGKIDHNIRCRLFRQALIVDYATLDDSRQGTLVNTFDTQIFRVMEAINALLVIVRQICRIIVFGARTCGEFINCSADNPICTPSRRT
jgi:subfamily B ATP-binding cassette protein MsbA